MNKTIVRLITLFFIVATVTGHINAAKTTTKKRVVRTRTRKRVAPQSPAAQVNKEMSILDQVVEQARIIVTATGSQANKTRSNAKKQLNDLMKDLDPKIKDVIADEIEIIQNTTARNRPASQAAYKRLIALVNSINAQANVVNAIEEGRKAIEIAPEEVKEQVIAQQVQNVQAAEAQAVEAGRMSQIVAGVKSALAAPGRYFFGEERTNAKTAFEVVVGSAVVGALAYGAYMISPETWQNLYSRVRGTTMQPEVQPEETLYEGFEPFMGEVPVRKPLTSEETRALTEQARLKALQTGQEYQKRTAEYLTQPEEFEKFRGEVEFTPTIRETGKAAGQRITEARARAAAGLKETGVAAYEYAQPRLESARTAISSFVTPRLERLEKAYRGPQTVTPEETGIIEPIEPGTEQ